MKVEPWKNIAIDKLKSSWKEAVNITSYVWKYNPNGPSIDLQIILKNFGCVFLKELTKGDDTSFVMFNAARLLNLLVDNIFSGIFLTYLVNYGIFALYQWSFEREQWTKAEKEYLYWKSLWIVSAIIWVVYCVNGWEKS